MFANMLRQSWAGLRVLLAFTVVLGLWYPLVVAGILSDGIGPRPVISMLAGVNLVSGVAYLRFTRQLSARASTPPTSLTN